MAVDSPTGETYGALLYAYRHFNEHLFEGMLPPIVFTYHRQNRVMGYASFQRWISEKEELIDELAINPEYFAKYPLIEICQTLVHEMVHVWQAKFGAPGRRGYHNKEWANKMRSIGLMPSSTGKPGGEITGEQMMDYVLIDGPFIKACRELANSGFKFPLLDRYPIFREEKPINVFDEKGQKYALRKNFIPIPERHESMEARRTDHDIVPVAHNLPELANQAKDFHSFTPVSVSTKPRLKSGRVKYVCKSCQSIVWAKRDLNIGCLDCNTKFQEDE